MHRDAEKREGNGAGEGGLKLFKRSKQDPELSWTIYFLGRERVVKHKSVAPIPLGGILHITKYAGSDSLASRW